MFILLDRPDETHDRMISEHIMRTHALASSGSGDKGAEGGGRMAGAGSSLGKSSSQPTRREEADQSTLSQRLRRVVEQYEPVASQMQSQRDAGKRS